MSEFATQGDVADINQTIDSLGDTYATKEELGDYLPLSGGRMTTINGITMVNGNYEAIYKTTSA